MANRHPLAALAGLGAFLLFALAVAVTDGYVTAALLDGFGPSALATFGVLLVIAAAAAYIYEDGERGRRGFE